MMLGAGTSLVASSSTQIAGFPRSLFVLPKSSVKAARMERSGICGAVIKASAETLKAAAAEEGKKETKLWGGRFEESVTPAVERFSQSVSYDKKLYKQDLRGSRAHAQMLAKQGLISQEDCDTILKGLLEIEGKIEREEFVWRADREDVHMNVEAALIDLVGEPAKKLHTARSRNDQVVTDVRLWCRDAVDEIVSHIHRLQDALLTLAVSNEGVIVPGYTHLQRAQPLLLQHLLLAFVEQLERDAGRLLDCQKRLNFSPLGACALAGTGLPIDRFETSKTLGFTYPLRNSVDAVSDRDFLIEFMSANAIIAVHLSRLAEEWVLWATEEFGFLVPSDAVSTGSSIMPQKKNPDPMELVRGKSARVIGDLTTILVLCKGLPLAYNRDLQEDKEPLFDSVETTIGVLEVTTEFAQNVTFNKERLAKSLSAGHLDATTMADYLVYKGIPFRTSHDIVGRAVALAVYKKVELSQLSLDEFRSINPIIDEEVYSFLGSENCINKFQSYGSTGVSCVAEQIDYWCQKRNLPSGSEKKN
ncbi:argininosuccinate lyase [Marchantia polymorpha subsp. ruderalis]|uniref:argininosuccinate lyase n=2 Tax=Marchantia polymorpha TaxID=3197 RepID=A0A176VFI1_MARPO|nr:hypothetical protein AXG93_1923s1120 [Marchantia polymorpha subsp. ruderalis]PTQ48568.1 hypothetical protein MARPO_0005s0193 [Marchantia polymorpha]BBM97240.1 hypothetical protein Mp_1g04140 [Marchantia polymorpha subsp. ruderalis]|eukprot:PTQ48568.1 hypothetical protein MARPO_0005s0193 [Marchantia polymorpha]